MRYSPNTGTVQINLSLPSDAYDLLQKLAPGKKAYGRFLGTLVHDYVGRQREITLEKRLERLELIIAGE